MDMREFALEMKRRGFGKPDVLAELYDPDTRKLVEVSQRVRMCVQEHIIKIHVSRLKIKPHELSLNHIPRLVSWSMPADATPVP